MHNHYGTCRGSVWFFADGFLKNYLVTWRPVVPSKQPGGEILKGGSRYTPFLHQSWKWKILEMMENGPSETLVLYKQVVCHFHVSVLECSGYSSSSLGTSLTSLVTL